MLPAYKMKPVWGRTDAWDANEIWLEKDGRREWTVLWQNVIGIRKVRHSFLSVNTYLHLLDGTHSEGYLVPARWVDKEGVSEISDAIRAHGSETTTWPDPQGYRPKPNTFKASLLIASGALVTWWAWTDMIGAVSGLLLAILLGPALISAGILNALRGVIKLGYDE